MLQVGAVAGVLGAIVEVLVVVVGVLAAFCWLVGVFYNEETKFRFPVSKWFERRNNSLINRALIETSQYDSFPPGKESEFQEDTH